MILRNDACIVTIGFYTAHFTAYQPQTNGNLEFCRELPDTGETIFVLDYLHASLSDVPVDFRIIRDLDGLGKFARWEDVQNLDDLEARTVFYQPPVVRGGGSFRVAHSFAERGDYIGIFTAGHPSNDNVYNAVFSFRVGGNAVSWPIVLFLVALLLLAAYLLRMKGIGASRPGTAA
ncbi:MAG: hypothetical protein BMS9Abin32_639 [Gammaproteobacteria bacterium]|nr:MAG: hypothetical protein BMS9Abin32_639 [Gammaproteobacteria bacterium]